CRARAGQFGALAQRHAPADDDERPAVAVRADAAIWRHAASAAAPGQPAGVAARLHAAAEQYAGAPAAGAALRAGDQPDRPGAEHRRPDRAGRGRPVRVPGNQPVSTFDPFVRYYDADYGAVDEDIFFYQELARRCDDPILEV